MVTVVVEVVVAVTTGCLGSVRGSSWVTGVGASALLEGFSLTVTVLVVVGVGLVEVVAVVGVGVVVLLGE